MNEEGFICPSCPQVVDESQKYCPKCGTALLWEKELDKTPRKGYRKGSLYWNLGILFVLVCIVIGALSNRNSTNTNIPNSNNGASVTDSSWVPSTYIQYSNSIAYNFPAKQDCSAEFTYCFQYEFMTKNGCPSGFYAALNWKDKSGAVLDYTNATLPSLQPMQVAKLTFNFTLPSDTSFGGLDIAEIRCY
jgi:hypothetical protein